MADAQRMYGDGEPRTALIALILKSGGQAEVGLEEYGEAAVAQQLGEVGIAIQRTAKGTAFTLVQSETAERRAHSA